MEKIEFTVSHALSDTDSFDQELFELLEEHISVAIENAIESGVTPLINDEIFVMTEGSEEEPQMEGNFIIVGRTLFVTHVDFTVIQDTAEELNAYDAIAQSYREIEVEVE